MLLYFHVGSNITISQVHTQTMQQTHMHKAVAQRVKVKMLLSHLMGLKLGVFGFLSTTQSKTNAKQVHPGSSHTLRHFTCFYLHAQTALDAGNRTNPSYFDDRKTPRQFELHDRIKMGQVLGSSYYIYG